eukprot:XP_015582235.1 uncharacterized protein LOC8281938 [Ricinus communis]
MELILLFLFTATVQVYFKLQKPVPQLVPHIGRLEYDIHEEIGVPNAKVAILSMHPSKPDASNCTDVVFGFLSDPIDVPINQVSLSVLKSSLIELLLHESNLTLTTPIFGQPSMFEILKFPGGITVIPVPYASIFQVAQILFNFTLNNSIAEILQNLNELRDQLKLGLHLRPYENIVVQITNTEGSTVDPPVTVEATVVSDLGSLLPQRLKQLVQTITDSPSKNLGLDNSVFGKVKSVVLSSYLKGRIHANPPTPSPAPSPEPNDQAKPPISICPGCDPSLPPASSPSDDDHAHGTHPECRSHHSLHPVNPPAPSVVPVDPPNPCRHHSSPVSRNPSPSHSKRSPYLGPLGPPSQLPPALSPLPHVSYGSSPRKGSGSHAHAPFSAPSLSCTVKAYFRLPKPILQLVSHVGRLESDLKQEIGIPTAKVAVLSMRQPGASNWTDVVFGFLPERKNVPINPVFLSVLRLSLVDVFLQESNLTLTTSIFGKPSAFEILKFPNGITLNPVQDAFICQMPQILFSFTLNHSVAGILDNLTELRDQLKFGLHLRAYENVIVQLTNTNGSTIYPPVTIQASVVSHLGSLLPQRLRQLAETIINSQSKNLGLNHWVFGKVKSVNLSSYLKGKLQSNPPTSSPAPSPELSDLAHAPISTYPSNTPSLPPSSSPSNDNHSHATSPKCGPHHSLSCVNSAAPSMAPPHPSGHRSSPLSRSPYLRPLGSPSQIPSDLSPLPQVSYGSTPSKGSVSQSLAPSPSAPSPSSVGVGPFCREIWWLGFSGLLVFHLLCCPH